MKYENRSETCRSLMAITAFSKFYPLPHIMGSSLHLPRCSKVGGAKNEEKLLDHHTLPPHSKWIRDHNLTAIRQSWEGANTDYFSQKCVQCLHVLYRPHILNIWLRFHTMGHRLYFCIQGLQ